MGYTLPTIAQAFIFIAIVVVDLRTLVLMIGAAVLGSWLGAGLVAEAPRRKIQIGMGLALLAAAAIFLMQIFQLTPTGGEAQGLAGWKLAAALGGNFVLGMLMEVGVGLYAPCMILVSLLGMSPQSAFPIMMGSCAFLMPVGSVRFIRSGCYSLRATLGLGLAGVPAVLIAAFLVKSLPLAARMKIVVEPGGSIVFAALLHGKVPDADEDRDRHPGRGAMPYRGLIGLAKRVALRPPRRKPDLQVPVLT